MQSFFSTTWMRVLAALALVMVIVALFAYTRLSLEQAKTADYGATISVEGTGEVIAVPDIGEFSFTVEAEADTAAAAQDASANSINEILSFLSEAGVAEADIKTANYNLYPRYRFESRVCPAGGFCPPGEQVQDGFTASQTVTVKVRDTEQAGDLLAGVGERGATNISNLSFTTDDDEALREEARSKAIADARAKAETLAEQLGVDLGRLISFYENNDKFYGDRAMMNEMSFAVEEAAGLGGATLPTGESNTTVVVNLTYEID